jgi:Patatin-like phospholipase
LTIIFGIATMLSSRFSEMVMPGTIIVFALCFWTFVGGFFNAISISWRFPIGFLMLILLFLASYFNNNHEIQSQNTFTQDSRKTVDEHFQAWKKSGNGTKKKVILVAAEGGGIRAAYWSANVLAALEKRFEKDSFYNSIFAMSGASGGSVGVMMYRAEHEAVPQSHDRQYVMDRICSSDFLSSLTSSFTFGDAIQRFIPFGFKNICRARYLENTFDEHFCMNTGYSSQLSQGVSTLGTDGPMLLLNTTHVESGQKAIITNDRLDTERYFVENQDVIHNIQADIPLKTAASASARFPLVTPPALLVNQQTGQRLGHLIDGGNFDNTGLHSLWQLLRQLRDLEKNDIQKSEVLILYIRNGSNLSSIAPTIGPTYELAPIYGFVGAWASQTISKPLDTQLLAKELNAQMQTIELDYTPKFAVLPLGWYLSPKAKLELCRQINTLDSEHNKAAVEAVGDFLK